MRGRRDYGIKQIVNGAPGPLVAIVKCASSHKTALTLFQNETQNVSEQFVAIPLAKLPHYIWQYCERIFVHP